MATKKNQKETFFFFFKPFWKTIRQLAKFSQKRNHYLNETEFQVMSNSQECQNGEWYSHGVASKHCKHSTTLAALTLNYIIFKIHIVQRKKKIVKENRVCLDLWPHECEHHSFVCFISCIKFSSFPFESSLIIKHGIRAWFSERGDWNSSTWSGRVVSIFIVGRKPYKDLGVCDQKKNRKQFSFKFIGMEILEE